MFAKGLPVFKNIEIDKIYVAEWELHFLVVLEFFKMSVLKSTQQNMLKFPPSIPANHPDFIRTVLIFDFQNLQKTGTS